MLDRERRLASLQAHYAGRVLTGEVDMAPFLTDWRKAWTGAALAVAQPGSTEEVAQLVRWCAANRTPLVPQGGNTSLSGGAVPDSSGEAVLLSLARLDRIRAIDPLNNSMIVEAGCILASVQAAAAGAGKLFPLSLAAEGSCTIGGNLASNAGGTAVLRYGNARALCLGLEVVTPNGEIWDGLRTLRKDNTGYDLRDLFIGSEGTLGVITAASLKLFPPPAGRAVALAAVPAPQKVLALFSRVHDRAGAGLTAFEFFSALCLDLVLKHSSDQRAPLDAVSPWYALIEISSEESETRSQEALEQALAGALDDGAITDAAVAASLTQAKEIWRLRESISEAQGAYGSNIKHDIALPISSIAEFITTMTTEIETRWPQVRVGAFGHVGDGNIHFNVLPAAPNRAAEIQRLQGEINCFVHDAVAARCGSISAEHGLGVLRRDEAARYKSEVEMRLMRSIKNALDPLGIMNPGKVLS